jgi:hypothetical protein
LRGPVLKLIRQNERVILISLKKEQMDDTLRLVQIYVDVDGRLRNVQNISHL